MLFAVSLALLTWLLAAPLAPPPEASARLGRFTTFLGVRLEQTTFARAASRLGPAQPKDNGLDAAGSASSICYRGPDGTTLILTSNSEMAAQDVITNYELVARPELGDYSSGEGGGVRAENKPRCSRLSRLSSSASIAHQLRLGASVQTVSEILGAATAAPGARSVRVQSFAPGSEGQTWRTVEVLFEEGRAVAIRVFQVTG
jgi:hypothetical protein